MGLPSRPDIPSRLTTHLHVTPDHRTLVATGNYSGQLLLLDLAKLFPAPTLAPAASLHLAEIDAQAEIMEGGGLHRYSDEAWLQH